MNLVEKSIYFFHNNNLNEMPHYNVGAMDPKMVRLAQ